MSWEDNAYKLAREIGSKLHEIEGKADKVVQTNQSRRYKYLSLRKLADEAAALVAPYTPCRKGCSYCCWMAVPIPKAEAEILADYTGRRVAKLSYPTGKEDAKGTVERLNRNADKDFLHKPCPFLSPDGECTVYEVRPTPCRAHHVIEESPEFCDLFSGMIGCHQTDIRFGTIHTTKLYIHEQFADIREWFPE